MADFWQFVLIGLVTGSLYALIALGYTMVYGIIELINFAHGDLFMLGSFLALTIGLHPRIASIAAGSPAGAAFVILLMMIACPLFCATLNVTVDRVVYKPLRNAPKLAPLVSAIGVSFIFMNIGLFWHGTYDLNFPNLVSQENLTPSAGVKVTMKDLMVLGITIPVMIALTVFVRYTPALGVRFSCETRFGKFRS